MIDSEITCGRYKGMSRRNFFGCDIMYLIIYWFK